MKKEDREQRFITEVRAINSDSDTEMILEGYAAVYGDTANIGGWFNETIERGAFEGADLTDVPLKYNHNDGTPILARTRNKSLELIPDDKGLKIRATLLDTSDAVDMYKRVKAGLIDKMSFAFTVDEETWDYNTEPITRKINKFRKIYDVSVVDVPAYDGTGIYARSAELLESNRPPKPEGRKKVNADIAGLMVMYRS